MTLLSRRGESNKTNANKASYEASYKTPLTRKTRLKKTVNFTKRLNSIVKCDVVSFSRNKTKRLKE